METRVLDGKPMSAAIREDVANRASALRESGHGVSLAVVLVGDDAASRIYSESICKGAGKLGIEARPVELSTDAGADHVARSIRALSEDPEISAIIVQQPLPRGIPSSIVEEVPPEKDVDGATVRNMGLLFSGREAFAPATALAVVETLSRSEIPVSGRHVVIAGRSTVVGRPLAALLLRKSDRGNATVTVCHTGTPDLSVHTRSADIVVAAMGSPEAIKGEMVREGSVVIDVGVNRIEDPASEKGYRIAGDVAFDEMLGKAAAVTPVPGGVGRLTTAILLRSAVEAAERASR